LGELGADESVILKRSLNKRDLKS